MEVENNCISASAVVARRQGMAVLDRPFVPSLDPRDDRHI
jgi:hypothetical protein